MAEFADGRVRTRLIWKEHAFTEHVIVDVRKHLKARPGICPSHCQHLISFPSVLKALHLSSVFITVDLPVRCSSICWWRAPPAYFPGEGDVGKLLSPVAPFFLPHTCLDSSQVHEWNWLTCMPTFLFSIEKPCFGKIPAECTAFAFHSCVTTEVTSECSLLNALLFYNLCHVPSWQA